MPSDNSHVHPTFQTILANAVHPGADRLMADLAGDTSKLTKEQQRERRLQVRSAKLDAMSELNEDRKMALRMAALLAVGSGDFSTLYLLVTTLRRDSANEGMGEGFSNGMDAMLDAMDRSGPRSFGERQSDETPDRVLPLVRFGNGDFATEVMP